MDIVNTVDDLGRMRRYAINEDVAPEDAAEEGIDVGVPDLTQLDWEELMVELSNTLFRAGIITKDDLNQKGKAFQSALKTTIGRAIIKLYGV